MQPTLPPPPTWAAAVPRSRPVRTADVVGWVALFVSLVVIDIVFVSTVKRVGSEHSAGPLLGWLVAQSMICVAGGVFQGVRHRRWWEIVIPALMASVLLAFVVLVSADPTAGSADCPSTVPCDTSFGLGAILIVMFTTPIFVGLVAIGRGVGGLARRTGR